MKISDRTRMIALGAAIIGSLALTVFNVGLTYNAIHARPTTIMLPQEQRPVRAGDVGCSRFPKACQCERDKEKGKKC